MKKLAIFAIVAGFIFASSLSHAQTAAPLGIGNFAVKIDYLNFLDDAFEDFDLQNALYVGVEGYASVFVPNLYFGMEVGWAGSSNDVDVYDYGWYHTDVDVDYVPIEFNAKYAFDLHPCVVLDVGAGISMNYFSISVGSEDANDWVFGGQFFADLNYKVQNWFMGVNLKYQVTDELELHADRASIHTDVSPQNIRIGGQAGFMF